jgi:hypothetical protein
MWCEMTEELRAHALLVSGIVPLNQEMWPGPVAKAALNAKDLQTLPHGMWYHDEIMNGLMAIAITYLKPRGDKRVWQLRNTFWAAKVDEGCCEDPTYSYKRHMGERDTKRVTDIWTHLHVRTNHWCAFLVNVQTRTALLIDPMGKKAHGAAGIECLAMKCLKVIDVDLDTAGQAWALSWADPETFPSQFLIDEDDDANSCGGMSFAIALCHFIGREPNCLRAQVKDIRLYLALLVLAGCAAHNELVWRHVLQRESKKRRAESEGEEGRRVVRKL